MIGINQLRCRRRNPASLNLIVRSLTPSNAFTFGLCRLAVLRRQRRLTLLTVSRA